MNITSEKTSTDGFTEVLSSGGPFVAMVNATRTPMVVTNPRLPDNPIVYANAAFMTMSGYSEQEIFGRNCRFLQGEATAHQLLTAWGGRSRRMKKLRSTS